MLSHNNTMNTVTNSSNMETITSNSTGSVYNDLSDKWTLWAHLPHNTDWSLKSYIKITEVTSVESVIALVNSLPDQMIKNCMLFFMKKLSLCAALKLSFSLI